MRIEHLLSMKLNSILKPKFSKKANASLIPNTGQTHTQ